VVVAGDITDAKKRSLGERAIPSVKNLAADVVREITGAIL
jgi:hypothetical protein